MMSPYLVEFFVRSHRAIFVTIALVIFFLFCCWGFGKVVDAFVPAYASVWAERLHVKLSFERARYVFPHQIRLKNLKIYDAVDPKDPIVEIPRVTLDFSSANNQIILSNMTLEHVSAHAVALGNYLKHSGVSVWQEFKQLSQSNLHITVTDTVLYLFQNSQTLAPINFKVDFSLSQGEFKSKFQDGPSVLQLWGYWKTGRLALGGYMFYQGPMMKQSVNVIDIKGFLNVDTHDITLKEFSFNINGNKFLATAHGLQQDPWPLDVHLLCTKPTQTLESTVHAELMSGALSVEGVPLEEFVQGCVGN